MHITRSELYQRVCALPLSKMAPDFGITATALAVICKRYGIPYPGSGYWTRKSLGLATELRTLPDGEDVAIEIVAPMPRTSSVKPKTKRAPKKARSVPEAQRFARHPLLIGVEAAFLKSRDIEEGEFLKPFKRILPDIVASPDHLGKALDLANEIYSALEAKGHHVVTAPPKQKMSCVGVDEQEVPQNNRRYGRYYIGSFWRPDRPTVVYIDSLPVGLALTEMTERVAMRYVNGSYLREDSKAVRSAKPWQLENSWTTDKDLPCGRFRLIAYSPLPDVAWKFSWQDTGENVLATIIPHIVEKLESAKVAIRKLMAAAEEKALQQQKEWDEQWERYRRDEDNRQVAKALAASQEQLAEIMDKWGRAMTVERFFAEAEARLQNVVGERHSYLNERLELAQSMVGTLDPLDFLGEWTAPVERYKTKYDRHFEFGRETAPTPLCTTLDPIGIP